MNAVTEPTELDLKTEKVINKVRRMLALADGNTNVDEAAVALAKAHRMLAENHLSLADVKDIEDAPKDWQIVHKSVAMGVIHRRTGYQWARGLGYVVSRACFCRHLNYNDTRHMCFIGTETDVDVAIQLYTYIVTELKKKCNIDRKIAGIPTPSGAAVKFFNDFMYGGAMEMQRRLESELHNFTGTQALTLACDKANEEYMGKVWPKMGSVKGRAVEMSSAVLLGHLAGKEIDLTPGAKKLK